jgi:DNA-binding MarR family transcriptional regulator
MTERTSHAESRDTSALAAEVWLLICDLVIDHTRRREVVDAIGLSFDRTRALRRVARRPMSMGELAAALGIDKPNATTVVDELEARGLVTRTTHPTDRRAKVVAATEAGTLLAIRADEIIGTPPDALGSLDRASLQSLRSILKPVVERERA